MPLTRYRGARRPYRRIPRRKPNPYKRRYVRRVPRSIARTVPLGVPRQRWAKLSYSDTLSASVGTSSYQTYAYQTSAYDPYVAIGGHQPMYFDQYSAMYRRYTVVGVAYQLEICIDSGTNGNLFVTVCPSNIPVTYTSLNVVRERIGSKETLVSQGYKGRLRGYVSTARTLGVDKRTLMTDDQYSALCTADPARPAYFNIQLWNESSGGDVAFYMSMRLTYYIRFFGPTDPAQS